METPLREVELKVREMSGAAPHTEITLISVNNKGAEHIDKEHTQDFSSIYENIAYELLFYINTKMDAGVDVTTTTTQSPDKKRVTTVFVIPVNTPT